MYSLLKSKSGAYPEPQFPQGIDLNAEDRKARGRLYPVTVVYLAQLAILLAIAARAGHLRAALASLTFAAVAWVPIEYWYHRYVLHGVFPNEGGIIPRALHYFFDASHADHHARPWDGLYINGHIDSLLFALLAMPLTFLAPVHTAPVFLASLLTCYMLEEWVHHSTHFWNLKPAYFQYVRRRHLYHHTRHSVGLAYGISNGIWDVVAGTRLPAAVRGKLALRRPAGRETAHQETVGRLSHAG